MHALELEGYFTGLIVTPDLIPPSLWLEALWGEDEPMFDNLKQAQNVLDDVMGFYNATIEKIDAEGAAWRPMYMDSSGTVDLEKAETWVRGFWEAISLEPEGWEALVRDERTQILVEPFVTLIDIGEFDDHPDPDNTHEVRRESAQFIPKVLPALRALAQIRASDDIDTIRRARKVGRNEPCPCGSGKKYKRCCGAN